MDIGLTLPFAEASRREFLTWCRRIDGSAFSSLAFGERLAYPNYDMVTTLSAAAIATERVRLIATVAVAPAHRTVALAKQAATIDVLSGGRLTLGVGVGGRREDYTLAEARFEHRHQRLDEQVALMRRIWAGEAPFAETGPVGPAPVQASGPPLLVDELERIIAVVNEASRRPA